VIIPFHVRETLRRVRERFSEETLARQMSSAEVLPNAIRPVRSATRQSVLRYWDRIMKGTASSSDRDLLADETSLGDAPTYSSNIENYIGTVKLPVGVVGPLRINGLNALGDYFVPLATTEAALVASYNRGAMIASKSGGINTAVLYEGVIRTPAFVLENVLSAGLTCC